MVELIKVKDNRRPELEFVLIEVTDFNKEFHTKIEETTIPISPDLPTEPQQQVLFESKAKNKPPKEVEGNG
jgi:hypothetical protein